MIKRLLVLIVTAALLLAACGGDDDDNATGDTADQSTDDAGQSDAEGEEAPTAEEADPTPVETEPTAVEPDPTAVESDPTPEPTEPPAADPITILVTNDDGIESEGIDALVQALVELPNVEVVVVAPAENQSGSSDTLSDGPLTGTDASTLSGYPAIAVTGTPGDSVLYALSDVLDAPPDLIVSGMNDGENVGPFASISGTVGATRIGARQGVPGVATSQGGVTIDPEFSIGVPIVIAYLEANLERIAALEIPEGELAPVVSINVPSCGETGEVKGALETELDDDFGDFGSFAADCGVDFEPLVTDVEAFSTGWAAITEIPEALVAGTEG